MKPQVNRESVLCTLFYKAMCVSKEDKRRCKRYCSYHHLILLHPWLVPSSGIAGSPYSCLASSSTLTCLLYCFISAPPLSCLSYTHFSTLGLASLFFFSLACPHLAFFPLCAPLLFSSHGHTTSAGHFNCV